MAKKVLSMILILLFFFSGFSCKKQEEGPDLIAPIDGFMGSISVGICSNAPNETEKAVIGKLEELLLSEEHHVVITESSDLSASVQDFVAGGMDFILVVGDKKGSISKEAADSAAEMGSYLVSFGESLSEKHIDTLYRFDMGKLSEEDAANRLLQYLYGIVILAEDCPKEYTAK
ncbi:MAG: hypothetical protein IKM38_00920 [Christensenellaceae bacterium]|nr:hypothetical protein [Christensenellaceae bacterium]